MKTLESFSSAELEMEMVSRAIARTDAEILRVETVIAQMRKKQIARHKELTRQETLHRQSAELIGGTGSARPKHD